MIRQKMIDFEANPASDSTIIDPNAL